MDVVSLRTLTGKSKLSFGKYKDMYVQQIIDLNEMVYLRWVYYNMSGITFCEDILEKIKISPELRIAKPGIAPELLDEVIEQLRKNMSPQIKSHVKLRGKYRAKAKLGRVRRSVGFSKKELQAINHGKY